MYHKKRSDEAIERFKETDFTNYLLGQYVGFAVNDPKRYPDKPFTEEHKPLEPMTDEEMEKQALRNVIKMGGEIHNS